MRKMLEIQPFLEYSMDVTKDYKSVLSVLCADFLLCSKIAQLFTAGGLSI